MPPEQEVARSNRAGRTIYFSNLRSPIPSRHLKPTVKRLGLNPAISWHWFRHTATSLADQVGMSPVDRCKGLGHTTDAMTMQYAHADVERVRQGLSRVAARLMGGGDGEVVQFPKARKR